MRYSLQPTARWGATDNKTTPPFLIYMVSARLLSDSKKEKSTEKEMKSSLHFSHNHTIQAPAMAIVRSIEVGHNSLYLSSSLNHSANLLVAHSLLRIRRARRNNRSVSVNCNSEKKESESMREALTGMVGERVEELLRREENRELLEGLERASERVERAKRELESIKKQEIEAARLKDYMRKLETRTSEIAECQRGLSEARATVEEAERSLSLNLEGVSSGDALGENSEDIDRDRERLESVKVASISAIVGTLAAIPLSFSQPSSTSQLILHLAVIFISCALFGVTFRYTIRRDLDNFQLKTGTAGAFSFVKGFAELEMGQPLEFTPGSIFSHAIDGALLVSQNLFIFTFAAISLDFCFKVKLLSPFPMKKLGA